MAFNYPPGQNWTPMSASDISNDLLNRINTILSQNSITNFLKPVISNVMWIFCLAVGQIGAIYQQLLYQASNAIDIATCSDTQVINLLPIIGTNQIEATKTTIWIEFTATPSNVCTVTPSNTMSDGYGNVFTPLTTVATTSGGTAYVQAICNVTGAIYVADSQITSFTSSPSNLLKMANGTYEIGGVFYGTIVGKPIETATQIRQRIINGLTIDQTLDGFIRALQSIQGLGGVNVVYNSSNAGDLTVHTSSGDIGLPPRQMWIFTQGVAITTGEVATAWYNYSLISTFNSARATITQTETVTTLSNQDIDVYYDIASTQGILVQILIPSAIYATMSTALSNSLKAVILKANNLYTTGVVVTSRDLSDLYEDYGFTGCPVYDCYVRSLITDPWGSYVNVYSDGLPYFSEANISITGV